MSIIIKKISNRADRYSQLVQDKKSLERQVDYKRKKFNFTTGCFLAIIIFSLLIKYEFFVDPRVGRTVAEWTAIVACSVMLGFGISRLLAESINGPFRKLDEKWQIKDEEARLVENEEKKNYLSTLKYKFKDQDDTEVQELLKVLEENLTLELVKQ